MKTVFLCDVSIRRNLSSKLLKVDKEAETDDTTSGIPKCEKVKTLLPLV